MFLKVRHRVLCCIGCVSIVAPYTTVVVQISVNIFSSWNIK